MKVLRSTIFIEMDISSEFTGHHSLAYTETLKEDACR